MLPKFGLACSLWSWSAAPHRSNCAPGRLLDTAPTSLAGRLYKRRAAAASEPREKKRGSPMLESLAVVVVLPRHTKVSRA
jgi:hypothetical protein